MQIRPYQETDRPFLRTLYLASRKAAFGWRDTSNYQLEDFDGATLGEAIWVAEDGGTLLGFVSVYREDNFIHNLYVDLISAARRRQCAAAGGGSHLHRHRLAEMPGEE